MSNEIIEVSETVESRIEERQSITSSSNNYSREMHETNVNDLNVSIPSNPVANPNTNSSNGLIDLSALENNVYAATQAIIKMAESHPVLTSFSTILISIAGFTLSGLFINYLYKNSNTNNTTNIKTNSNNLSIENETKDVTIYEFFKKKLGRLFRNITKW